MDSESLWFCLFSKSCGCDIQERLNQKQDQSQNENNPARRMNIPIDPYRQFYDQTTKAIKTIAGVNAVMMLLTVLLVLGSWYQACLTRDTLHDSERAFLYRKEVKLPGDAHGRTYFLMTYIANAGLTQARRTKVEMGIVTLIPSPPPNWNLPSDFPYTENQPTQNMNVIPPRESPGILMPVQKGIIDELRSNQAIVFIFGTIRYCDIFNQAHFTQFCDRSTIYSQDAKTGQETFEFGPCSDHNCDDYDCPAKFWPKDRFSCHAN